MPKGARKTRDFDWQVRHAFDKIDEVTLHKEHRMKTTVLAQSIAMMKAILDAQTYAGVARDNRLSGTAVEQRVKALARDVQRMVGVVEVGEEDLPTAALQCAQREGDVKVRPLPARACGGAPPQE